MKSINGGEKTTDEIIIESDISLKDKNGNEIEVKRLSPEYIETWV